MKTFIITTAIAGLVAIVNGAQTNETSVDSLVGTWYTVGVDKQVLNDIKKNTNATCNCQQIIFEKGEESNQLNAHASCMLKINPNMEATKVSSKGVLTLQNGQNNNTFEFEAQFANPTNGNGTKPSKSASASGSVSTSATGTATLAPLSVDNFLLANLATAKFRMNIRAVSSQNNSESDALYIQADQMRAFNIIGSEDKIDFLAAHSVSIDADQFNKTLSEIPHGDQIARINDTCNSQT